MAANTDVIVVGAGLAGLSAARLVARSGRTVLVLEAGTEVGGRARTRMVGGEPADLGGEWVGNAHRAVHELASQLGIGIEPANTLGRPVRWRLPSGEHVGRLPPASTWRGLLRLGRYTTRASRGLDPRVPWAMPSAAEHDARSVADVLDKLDIGGDARYLVDHLVGALSSSTPDRMSSLQFLWWLRLAGGPVQSLTTTFQSRIVGGAQALPRAVAAELEEAVRLNTPVHLIEDQGDYVRVATEDGTVRTAAAVIVAVPVQTLRRITIAPAAPPASIASQLHVGPGVKIIARLPADRVPSYHTVVGGETLWGSWRRGRRVTGFAPPQAEPADEATRIAALAESFEVDPAELEAPQVMDWAEDPWVQGCGIAFSPGQIRAIGPGLRRHTGRLYFAGAERSSWPNNLEGAVQSGQHAATQVLKDALHHPA